MTTPHKRSGGVEEGRDTRCAMVLASFGIGEYLWWTVAGAED